MIMAFLPWKVWHRQDERQWPETARAMRLPQPLHCQLLFQDQTSAQGLLETPALKALASAGSYPGQTNCH